MKQMEIKTTKYVVSNNKNKNKRDIDASKGF